nr:unnamed protein product [Callosobruchus analis]
MNIGDHNKPENINYQQKQDQRKTLNNYYCIIHQNVQSLGNSVDKINLVLQEHPLCKVLCVTEHWKSEEQLQQIGIQGFKLASSFCREEGHHGGAAVYVEKNVMFQENRNLNKISVIGEFECAVVEYKIGNRHFVCCAIYRPPSGDRRIFFLKLEELLTHLNQTKIIIITGDFNIEMFYENNLNSELYSLMYSFSLKPKINGFTRVTSHSQSGLDNIFTNHINCTAEVLETHISDHSAQKMVVPLESIYDNRVSYRRFFTDNAKSNFQNELKQQDWQEVFEVSEQNVNLQWKLFISNFINIFNMCFPRRRIYPKQYKIKYKTNEKIQECKNRLDKLLVLYRHNKLFKFDYDNTKKEYDRLIIEQRKKDMESKIYNSDNKSKAMWVICNEIRGHVGNDDECKIPGDPYEVANKVNHYLSDLVPNIMQNLDNTQYNCEIPYNTETLCLRPITADNLVKLSNKLKNKYSSGADELPMSIIKTFLKEIKDILSYIINNSLKFGIFPEQLKLSEIKPLLKKGDPTVIENYRPISILNSFSKIFEHVVCAQLTDFMDKCNLFSNTQHGYIKGRSSISALYQFTQEILTNIENKNLAMGLFLDLSKAYDCLNHTILYDKLDRYGMRANTLDWIKSYLTNRQQRVIIKNDCNIVKSDIICTNVGVPQGSVLGPILFVIYINDLNNSTRQMNFTITNYADDTSLLISDKSTVGLGYNGEKAFDSVRQWFTMNKLHLNQDKTNLIIFRTKRSHADMPQSFDLSGTSIPLSQQTKLLGIYLDEFMSWSPHINNTALKLSSISYGIRVLSKYLKLECLKILYYANFESILRYGIILFGCSSDMQKVFIIQKRTIRAMMHMKFNQTCKGVFKSVGLMTAYAIYIFECIMFTVKNREKFRTQNDHLYSTRATNVLLPPHRLTLTEKNCFYMCAKFYNKLPISLKTISTTSQLKKHLKEFLIQLEPYSISEFLDVSF